MTPGDKLLAMIPSTHLTPAALLDREAQLHRDLINYGISICDEHGRRIDPNDFYIQPEEADAPAPALRP